MERKRMTRDEKQGQRTRNWYIARHGIDETPISPNQEVQKDPIQQLGESMVRVASKGAEDRYRVAEIARHMLVFFPGTGYIDPRSDYVELTSILMLNMREVGIKRPDIIERVTASLIKKFSNNQ